MIAEKNIQFSGYAVRISAKSSGLQILQDVSEKNKFFENIQNQYGFDDTTIKIMKNVYNKIKQKYGNEGAQYVDWMFFRALSQVGGYDDDDFSGAYDAANVWKQGAGNAYPEEKHKKFMWIH